MKTLKDAIRDNQRFHKYERILHRVRLRVFDYEDEGKAEKAERVIKKIKAICEPWWQKRADRQRQKRDEQLLFRTM